MGRINFAPGAPARNGVNTPFEKEGKAEHAYEAIGHDIPGASR